MLYGLWKSKQEKESEFLTEQIIKETAFINELKSKYQGDSLQFESTREKESSFEEVDNLLSDVITEAKRKPVRRWEIKLKLKELESSPFKDENERDEYLKLHHELFEMDLIDIDVVPEYVIKTTKEIYRVLADSELCRFNPELKERLANSEDIDRLIFWVQRYLLRENIKKQNLTDWLKDEMRWSGNSDNEMKRVARSLCNYVGTLRLSSWVAEGVPLPAQYLLSKWWDVVRTLYSSQETKSLPLDETQYYLFLTDEDYKPTRGTISKLETILWSTWDEF